MFTSREFFGILGPVIIDQFFMYLISMLTTAMISASSQDSVSAVSLVNPILFLVMALFGAVANGGTVVVAQYKGKGNPLRVWTIFQTSERLRSCAANTALRFPKRLGRIF